MIAAEQGNEEVMQYLLGRGVEAPAALHFALRYKSLEALLTLWPHLPHEDTHLCDGETPLICALKTGNTDAAATLLTHGADLCAREIRGQTALELAQASGAEALTRLLPTNESVACPPAP